MGRNVTPTALKLVNGNPGKRALNRREPDPDYLDDLAPPAVLSDAAKEVWNQEAPALRKAKLLTVLDRLPLELLCEAVAGYRAAKLRMAGKEPAQGGLSIDEQRMAMYSKQIDRWSSKFGMGPRDRANLLIDPQLNLFGGGENGGSKEDGYFTS